MPVLPFRWHGSARLARIEREVAGRAAGWLREWAVAPARTRCEVGSEAAPCHAVPSGGEAWYVLRPAAGNGAMGELLLRGPDYLLDQLGADLADIPVPARDLSAGVAHRALAGFGRALFGEAVVVEAVESAAPRSLEARRGVAAIGWQVGSLALDLFLDRALCDALVPPPRVAGAPLVAMGDALREEAVPLRAVLDLGTATLEEALGLRPGDIIRTETPIAAALVRLEAGEGALVAAGVLVASGPQRGVRISNPPKRTP
jgi:hypothetical protein